MRAYAWLAAALLAACGGGGGSAGGGGVAPGVTLTEPAPFADGLTGVVPVRAQASASGVAAVEFQLDGIALADDASEPFEANVDTRAHAAGQHVLRARARDAAGNVSAWASVTVRFAGGGAVGSAFVKQEPWVAGLTAATAFAQAPDGRWFVAEQGGTLRVVKNGTLLATPFAQVQVDSRNERGLIGVALHPQFASNGFVYLHYTTPAGGTHNRISRMVANGDVSDGSETVLVDLPTLSGATNHNGGALHFGADGKLYVGVGDNANSANAQDRNHPFGKLLRFNDDGSIPADNPFFAVNSGVAQAVWAYGLRNPFTFAIQPGTGRIHINDVGESTWEEIDVGEAGANYGWPLSEGPQGVSGTIAGPLFAYAHAAASPPGSGPGGFFTGIAIAGGAFYPEGGAFPAAYHGNYFFADFGSGFVARLDPANDNAAYAFAQLDGAPVDMRVGNDGALYVLTLGTIVRIAAR